MTLIELANKKLAIEAIIAQLCIIGAIVYALFLRKAYPAIGKFLAKYGILLAFLMALVATASSLFYSNIAGFAPCDLCWFQRVFMYPLVVILGIALLKKDRKITDYGLVMAAIGFCISLYQNFLYYQVGGLNASCSIGGAAVSCVKRYVLEFGYVTIPVMALTGFAVIITFLLFSKFFQSEQHAI